MTQPKIKITALDAFPGNNKVVVTDATGKFTISNLVVSTNLTVPTTPSTATSAASKQYVDTTAAGFSPHVAARVATTGELTSSYANGTAGVGATLTGTGAMPTVDGITLAVADRVLVKDQSTQAENGIYVVTQITSNWILTRATDYDSSPASEISAGNFVYVIAGTLNAGKAWIQVTKAPITVGTTNIVFTVFTPMAATAAPVDEILYGTGSGTASSTQLSWNDTTSTLQVGDSSSIQTYISNAEVDTSSLTSLHIKASDNISVTSGPGGELYLTGGSTLGNLTAGGKVVVSGGSGGGVNVNHGGPVQITGGNAGPGGNGGDVTISGGVTDTGIGGYVTIQTATTSTPTTAISITPTQDVSIGVGSLATTATNGFPYFPTCAGTPTGTPTVTPGFAPVVIDITNDKMYFYGSAGWVALN